MGANELTGLNEVTIFGFENLLFIYRLFATDEVSRFNTPRYGKPKHLIKE